MKKWLLSRLVTPKRVRKIVASVVSWLIYGAIARGIWDSVMEVARWMRRLADFIEGWDSAALPEDKDRLLSGLVSSAITDEAVDRLLERIVAMKAAQAVGPAAPPELPAAEAVDVDVDAED